MSLNSHTKSSLLTKISSLSQTTQNQSYISLEAKRALTYASEGKSSLPSPFVRKGFF